MTSKLALALGSVPALVLLAGACSLWTDGAVEGGTRRGPFEIADLTAGDGGVSPAAAGDAGAAPGLPCDVDAVLASECRSCHGASPVNNKVSLVTYADLTAASAMDKAQSNAERSVARMLDTASPMPTSGIPPRATTSVLEAWIAAGYPTGSCGAGAPAGRDAGAPRDAGGAATCDPPAALPSPSSGRHNAGASCIESGCHTTARGALSGPLTIAGTLYGAATGGSAVSQATIHVVDAQGRDVKISTATNGNFWSTQTVTFPVTVRASKCPAPDQVMATPVAADGGSCNSCHGGTNRIFLR